MDDASKAKIVEGLKGLDPGNDNHWTMTGEAKLETVKFLAGGINVTRDELNEIAPGFNRDQMRAYVESLKAAEVGNAEAQGSGAPGPDAGAGADDVAEQPAMEDGPTVGETDLEALAEEINRAEQAVRQLERIHQETGKDLDQAKVELDRLLDAQTKANPIPTHTQNLIGYRTSQMKLKGQRIAAQEKLENLGVDVDALQQRAGPSPIDRTMAGRGRRR